jgi:lipopolysaccharide transport system ATP-binding protein
VYVTAIEIKDLSGNILYDVKSGQDIDIYFHFETTPNYRQSNVTMNFMVRTYLDMPVFLQHNRLTGDNWENLPRAGAFVCRIRNLPLPPANYRWGYNVMCGDEYLDKIDDLNEISVIEGDFYGSGILPAASHGCVLVDAKWHLSESN